MQEIWINVPGIPPSVNNYVRHARGGHFKTEEAKAFEQMFALAARDHRGNKVEASEVDITVTLGPKQRGDIDNFIKLILDSLVRCEVIRSDATITHLVVNKGRGKQSRTDIWVRWE